MYLLGVVFLRVGSNQDGVRAIWKLSVMLEGSVVRNGKVSAVQDVGSRWRCCFRHPSLSSARGRQKATVFFPLQDRGVARHLDLF